jgi:hypothetical protein
MTFINPEQESRQAIPMMQKPRPLNDSNIGRLNLSKAQAAEALSIGKGLILSAL